MNNNKMNFECLTVTDVKVHPLHVQMTHIRGLATIVLNDQVVVRGLRVMDGESGLFVGYPNDPFYKGEDLRTVFQPINRQLREHIENKVLEKYQEELAKNEAEDD